MFFKIHPLIEH